MTTVKEGSKTKQMAAVASGNLNGMFKYFLSWVARNTMAIPYSPKLTTPSKRQRKDPTTEKALGKQIWFQAEKEVCGEPQYETGPTGMNLNSNGSACP